MATESHASDAHAGVGVRPYLVVFTALVIFTAISFLANYAVQAKLISPNASFATVLGVAVCKAVLVATFFMHLKYDWFRLYFVIVPVMILAVMMIIVFLPDIVLAWHQVSPTWYAHWINPH